MTGRSHMRVVTLTVACLIASLPVSARSQTHNHAPPPAEQAKPAAGQHDHQHPGAENPPTELPPFIPRLTDEERRAALPDLQGHVAHDNALHAFTQLDRFEWQQAGDGSGVTVDAKGWLGRDRDRVWFRAEGDSADGRVGEARAHVLYGRQVSRWWDLVAGIRQDFSPGPAQTWAAIGVHGLAPYWFGIEATGYIGAGGRTQVRFEIEYELLITNTLVLQPLAEIEVSGKSDPERGVGAGLSSTDAGFRLRYEFRRELAPYVGVAWKNKWGKTADLAAAADEDDDGARFVTGLRLWF